MLYRKLGNAPFKVSVIGLGALHFGSFSSEKQTEEIISCALDLGVNLIDTAPMYGKGQSESFIGKAVKNRRDKVIIATKVGLSPATRDDGSMALVFDDLNEKHIRSSLEKSLKELDTDYIDYYQLHVFDKKTPVNETYEVMGNLIKEGKIRAFGASNYLEPEFKHTLEVIKKTGCPVPSGMQVHYNMIERLAEKEMLGMCADNNVDLLCNRALSAGILTGKYKKDKPLPENSRGALSARTKRQIKPETLELTEKLENFAKASGHTITELAIAWLLSRKGVSSILAGARNAEQIKGVISGADWKLSEQDTMTVDNIINGCNAMEKVKNLPSSLFPVND